MAKLPSFQKENIMFKFKTRNAARSFKAKNAAYKLVDLGASVAGSRWAVVVLK